MKEEVLGKDLVDFLGAENVKQIRSAVTKMIIERFKDDISNFDEYTIYPEDVQEIISEIIDESVKPKIELIVTEHYIKETEKLFNLPKED